MIMAGWGDSLRRPVTRCIIGQLREATDRGTSRVDDDGRLGGLTAGPVSQEIGQSGRRVELYRSPVDCSVEEGGTLLKHCPVVTLRHGDL